MIIAPAGRGLISNSRRSRASSGATTAIAKRAGWRRCRHTPQDHQYKADAGGHQTPPDRTRQHGPDRSSRVGVAQSPTPDSGSDGGRPSGPFLPIDRIDAFGAWFETFIRLTAAGEPSCVESIKSILSQSPSSAADESSRLEDLMVKLPTFWPSRWP
jgi:hypothetical protein